MEDNLDIRWKQRFANYVKALHKLEQAVDYINQVVLNKDDEVEDINLQFTLDEIIKEGLIQRFEYTHELAWNVMKDYANYQGNSMIGGSKDATREAFKIQLISDGHIWMRMIESRNQTSHTYNESLADEIYHIILKDYFHAFLEFKKKMAEKKSGEQANLFNEK